ncbi:hypothetical protein F5888DRAFT_1805766 [Russula emetica]|nr:hypothetical protein F5888DRAFT_1805766 [Russula emetica]
MPTHTPERKREHIRFPSEGIFNLSSDEDSSFFSPSDASGELKAKADFPLLITALLRQPPLRRRQAMEEARANRKKAAEEAQAQEVEETAALNNLLEKLRNGECRTAVFARDLVPAPTTASHCSQGGSAGGSGHITGQQRPQHPPPPPRATALWVNLQVQAPS